MPVDKSVDFISSAFFIRYAIHNTVHRQPLYIINNIYNTIFTNSLTRIRIKLFFMHLYVGGTILTSTAARVAVNHRFTQFSVAVNFFIIFVKDNHFGIVDIFVVFLTLRPYDNYSINPMRRRSRGIDITAVNKNLE